MKKTALFLSLLVFTFCTPSFLVASDTIKQDKTKSTAKLIDQNRSMEMPDQEGDDC